MLCYEFDDYNTATDRVLFFLICYSICGWAISKSRVATAQGKQGIWLSLFPDRENTGNLGTTQGKFGQQGIFQISLKMKF